MHAFFFYTNTVFEAANSQEFETERHSDNKLTLKTESHPARPGAPLYWCHPQLSETRYKNQAVDKKQNEIEVIASLS